MSIAFLVFSFCHLSAQQILPVSGDRMIDLKPESWRFISSATGDVNNDKLDDMVFIIQDTDTSKITWDVEGGYCLTNTNPRIIAVYLADAGGFYRKFFESDHFIDLKDDEFKLEPLTNLSIEQNGFIKINQGLWMGAGTWEGFSQEYNFTFNVEFMEFELAQFSVYLIDRASGDFTDNVVDLVAQKTWIETGNVSRKKTKKKFTPITNAPRITWMDLVNGHTYEINGISVR